MRWWQRALAYLFATTALGVGAVLLGVWSIDCVGDCDNQLDAYSWGVVALYACLAGIVGLEVALAVRRRRR